LALIAVAYREGLGNVTGTAEKGKSQDVIRFRLRKSEKTIDVTSRENRFERFSGLVSTI
jgi:hypothetical protein